MKVSLTVISQSDLLRRLVGDFAKGLGCASDADASGELRIDLPDAGDALLELLDYLGLSAARAGVEIGEPLCRLRYRRDGASAEVTIDLRITAFGLANPRPDASATDSGSV